MFYYRRNGGGGEYISYFISFRRDEASCWRSTSTTLRRQPTALKHWELDLCLKAGVDVPGTHLQCNTGADKNWGSSTWVDLTSGIVMTRSANQWFRQHACDQYKEKPWIFRKCLENTVKCPSVYSWYRCLSCTSASRTNGQTGMGGLHCDAIKGVTVNAAKMCGLGKTKGSLEVGKQGRPLYCSKRKSLWKMWHPARMYAS